MYRGMHLYASETSFPNQQPAEQEVSNNMSDCMPVKR
jgi:hypothetical protein